MNDLETGFQNLTLSPVRVVAHSADIFRKLCGLLHELVHDVNLVFTERGLKIHSMDTCHVCFISLRIDAAYFKEYKVLRETIVGIKLETLVRVLGCVENDVVVEYHDDDLVIRSEDSLFSLKTLSLESEDMDVPDMVADVEIDADAGVIQKYLKNMAMFGDTLRLFSKDDEVHMSTSGDIGLVNMKLQDQRVRISGTLSASFATRYILTFAKAANISKRVLINITNENPIHFKYQFGENSWIQFYLAPKIDEEDD
jgi:proliferating cell nuclear antigen